LEVIEAVLNELYNLSKKRKTEIYLVGGAVRDLILGKKINDLDFVVEDTVKDMSKKIADTIDGALVELDQKRGTYRVIKGKARCDFNKMKGNTIQEDLFNRDFTINTLALPFSPTIISLIKKNIGEEDEKNYKEDALVLDELLIDPFNGRADIRQKRLKLVEQSGFVDDPLRILRSVRFKAELFLEVESTTEDLMIEHKENLYQVARERIKDELLRIFSLDNVHNTVEYMEDRLGILSYLFPELNGLKEIGECKYHNEDDSYDIIPGCYVYSFIKN
jgi:poly(A) polymerase